MGFLKTKFSKNNEENKKISTQPSVANENKEKKPAEDKEQSIHEFPKLIYKPLVKKKFTILLVENTTEVAKEKDALTKIVKSLVSPGGIKVINYGTTVRQSKILDVSNFDDVVFLYDNDIGDNACLYDALQSLARVISKVYMHTEEQEKQRIMINEAEIIGIGTCKDNCSEVEKEAGIAAFCEIASKAGITTKYFCLTDESFIDAAEIGFRSIGAILRNYQ